MALAYKGPRGLSHRERKRPVQFGQARQKKDERVILTLRGMYEQYGYKKYRMGKFEDYDLYLQNKSFLKSKNIITFHDLDGRVKALKPDVTLSIAKNTHATSQSTEKFYYVENVYRLDGQNRSYPEISQLGLETIGRLDTYAEAEVLSLAQKTMQIISPNNIMQLSHIGFVLELLNSLSVDRAARHRLTECIRAKNVHELSARAQALNIPPAAAGLLVEAAKLCGPFAQTLGRARRIAITPAMNGVLDELEAVERLMRCCGADCERLMLDFSLVDDADYYSGLTFRGYVEGVPRAVLAGGAYGNLLKKFGRDLDAIGFAVYLNELTYFYGADAQSDVDILCLYDEQADLCALAGAVEGLIGQGLRVRVERRVPAEVSYERLMRFENGALVEVSGDA